MAIIKMLNSKTKQTNASMKKAVGYSLKMEAINNLASGINCNFDTAFEEFCLTKKIFHKEKGRLYIHFEQSFPPDADISPEQVHDLGRRLIEECDIFKGFQVVIGTHTDKDHLHNHFVINTVNADTGQKWHLSNYELTQLRSVSLEICREQEIPVWWDPKLKDDNNRETMSTASRGEYEKIKNGESWKYRLFQKVKESIKKCNSKEDFLKEMEKDGYSVHWTDQNKFITFTTPEGMKCRNNKLYPIEKFTKENILKQIENKPEIVKEKSEGELQKGECFKAIMTCIKHSHNQDEFINNMEALGYGVQWDHHKHLLFTTPDGKRFREDKFYPSDRITKDKLLQQFENNTKRRSIRTRIDHKNEMNRIVANLNNVSTILQVVKNHNNSNDLKPSNKMERKKNLEGDALKEKVKEKKTSTYDWDSEPEM